MAQLIADRRDIDFVLHEQFQVEELSRHERFAEFNKKTIDMIVTEARNVAIKEILPTNKLGDQEGCKFKNGNTEVGDQGSNNSLFICLVHRLFFLSFSGLD